MIFQKQTAEQKWDNATLANGFIFYKVMRHHPDACKKLLELLLQIKIADTKELPERARYYQGVMDLDSLKSGEQYKNLRDSHVIFLCMEDIFLKEYPIYTFENICLEDKNIKLNDRTYKHFFIVPTCAKIIEDIETRSFFEFLISNNAKGEFTRILKAYVADAKRNMQWRIQFMTWERQRAYDFADGKNEGKQETAKNLIKMNVLSVEQIAQATGLSIDDIKKLKES